MCLRSTRLQPSVFRFRCLVFIGQQLISFSCSDAGLRWSSCLCPRDPALVVLPFREANRPILSFLFLHRNVNEAFSATCCGWKMLAARSRTMTSSRSSRILTEPRLQCRCCQVCPSDKRLLLLCHLGTRPRPSSAAMVRYIIGETPLRRSTTTKLFKSQAP